MGFILSVIAHILFSLLWIVNFPLVLIIHTKKQGFLRTVNGYWMQDAINLDRFGNNTYRTLWNFIFIEKNGYKFGNENETISSALGKNQRDGTLILCGLFICFVLDALDEDHCKKSIKILDK